MMHFDRANLSNEKLVDFYKALLYPRLIEEKMLLLLRQGKISKWFSGIGQEAIAVGATLALQPDEWIFPLHRNLGVFTTRSLPLHKLVAQWQGSQKGYSNGRERSFHFGSKENFICGMISHLGPQLALADGVALAYQLKKQNKVTLAFSGDGGTSEGDFHEALNVAAVWNLPVIFLIENNGYGLSTPVSEQFKCYSLADKAVGYGMEGISIDGNNLLAVYDTIKGVREFCIQYQKPYLIECNTFRMRGHEEASGTKYVPKNLLEEWAEKDPVLTYELFLQQENILSQQQSETIKNDLKIYIDSEVAQGLQPTQTIVSLQQELNSVYSHHDEISDRYYVKKLHELPLHTPANELRFVNAITEALDQSMSQHPQLIIMGQDVAEYGGAFKVTEGLAEKYGKARVRNTPLCESAIIGAGLGLSLEGFKTVIEMQFADFITAGFNQVVNNLAKIQYRWGQHADVVIRMPAGAGIGAGPFHSQSNEAWFTHVPGLKVVYPCTPADAKGLLIAAINDPGPVMFFEHKALYRSIKDYVPGDYYEVEIGKARSVAEGSDITIITYGMGVHWALEEAAEQSNISVNILDLCTLQPLDYTAIKAAVQQTGKVLILHEDTLTGGIGGEISAWIAEHCFEYLDAPVMRCASLDTPVPFNSNLEKQFLAKARLKECIASLLNY